MTDYSCPDFPARDVFLGAVGGKPDAGVTGGYAKEIYELAVKVHGENELQYIPLDSPAHFAAGLKYVDILGMSEEKMEIWSNNGPYALDENDRYLGTTEQWNALYEKFSWVSSWWSDNVGPEPDGFDTSIQDLANAADALYAQSTGVDAAGPAWQLANTALGNWQSEASDTFQQKVWTRIPNIIRRQASVIGAVFHSVTAERGLWLEHRKSLESIAQQTIAAIEAIKEEHEAEAESNLSILQGLATVAAAALAFPSGGASLAALGSGITIASGLAAAGKGMADQEAAEQESKEAIEKMPLGDSTVSGVLQNMSSAGAKCYSDVTIGEQDICDGLQEVYNRMTDTSTQEGESDIPVDELPEGVKPGQQGEESYTPRQKFVIPKPALVDETASLPEPTVPT